MSEERNVKIISTFLGREDHGIPSFTIHCQGASSVQGFGGWDLRLYGIDAIMKIIETVGVPSWEALSGAYCRVRGDRSKLCAIGHLIDDKWFDVEASIEKRRDASDDTGTE